MSKSERKDVLEFLEDTDAWYKNQWAVYYKGRIVFLDRKARNIYRSEKLARNAAAKHLYTTTSVIDELIKDGILKIAKI